MKLKLILVGILMMVPLIAVKFIPALLFLGPFLIFFVLAACVGMCVLIAGVSSFTNIEKQPVTEDQEKTD
jgi:hypothetical protein